MDDLARLELEAEVARLRLENARLRAAVAEDGPQPSTAAGAGASSGRPPLRMVEVEVVADPVNPVQVWPVHPNAPADGPEVPWGAVREPAPAGVPGPIEVVLTPEERAADQAAMGAVGPVEIVTDQSPEASIGLRPPVR